MPTFKNETMKNPQSYFYTLNRKHITFSNQCFLTRVDQIVFRNMDKEDFKIDCLCKQLFLSRMQLHRKLKCICGLSTSAYIRKIKLQRAMNLMKNTDLNISQIAYKLGYKDPSYFTRIFVQRFHISPSQMRKKWTNENDSNQMLQ